MRRALTVLGGWLAWASVASADIAPPPQPGRPPEWDYTPLPMPDEPDVAVFLAAIAIALAFGFARRRSLGR